MDWYWWILIAVAVAVIGWVKVKVLGKWMEKRKAKAEAIDEE